MGIRVMPMIVRVVMPMAMRVVMIMRVPGTDTFHVMVMAFLSQSHLILETQHLGAVFAHPAIHRRIAGENLLHTFLKSLNHHSISGWRLATRSVCS